MARDLTVVTRGEPMPAAMRRPYRRSRSPPRPASRCSRRAGTAASTRCAPRRRRRTTPGTWSRSNGDELATGCGEGLFEKLDWSAIGGKDHYLPQAVSDCGVGAAIANLVLAWDRDKFPATPTWADFWDVAKYPGKRGLRKGVRGNLEIALIADGVAPADVYKVLATSATAWTARSASSTSSSRISCGGRPAPRRRTSWAPATC